MEKIQEVTTAEAANMLECSPRTIRNMIKRKTITARLFLIDPTVKKGVYLIPKAEIDLLVKRNKNNPRQARVTSSS